MTQYTKIEIIFDKDHSTRDEGWYVRISTDDGQEQDRPISEDWWEDSLASDGTIRSWAVSYFRVSADLIEIRR